MNGAYYKIIISIWLLSLLLASVDAVIYQYGQAADLYLWVSYIVLALLKVTVLLNILVQLIQTGNYQKIYLLLLFSR